MKTYEIYQGESLIADRVSMADNFIKRFLGLMPKKKLEDGEGLILKKCSSIHCFFMKFTIDVIYLDKDFTVLAKETVRPWHIGGIYKGAKHVVELKEGMGNILEIGKQISVKEI